MDASAKGMGINRGKKFVGSDVHMCSGKAQKGHLAFEAGFECANLGRVDFISDTEFDLYVRPDTCNPRHR